MSAYKVILVALKYAFVIVFFFIKGQESADIEVNPLIYGGKRTDIRTRPFQVSIQFRPNHHDCGGSIINKYFILTAAHCLFKTREEHLKYLVVVGTTDLKKPYKTYKLADVIIHEKFNEKYDFKSFGANDIALLKVAEPIKFSSFVKPIKLASPRVWYGNGTPAVVSGYGACEYPKKRDGKCDILRKANVYIEGQKECIENMKEAMGYQILSTQICYKGEVVNDTHREGSSGNDSGGPVTVGDRLVGIISWGNSDLQNLLSAKINTRVSKYVYWIRRKILESPHGKSGNNNNAFEKAKYHVIIITLFYIFYFTFQNLTY